MGSMRRFSSTCARPGRAMSNASARKATHDPHRWQLHRCNSGRRGAIMSSKNRSFAAGLMGSLEEAPPKPEAAVRMPVGILANRESRMSELANGAVVSRAVEQVDPARCRLWSEHNRDYAKLDETRCADLIESFKAQGRQEVPAIVRRVKGDPEH